MGLPELGGDRAAELKHVKLAPAAHIAHPFGMRVRPARARRSPSRPQCGAWPQASTPRGPARDQAGAALRTEQTGGTRRHLVVGEHAQVRQLDDVALVQRGEVAQELRGARVGAYQRGVERERKESERERERERGRAEREREC